MTDEKDPAAEPVFVPWLVALLVAATLGKLVLLTVTRGSSDAELWIFFAIHARKWGLFDAYTSIGPLCNHPPLALFFESATVDFGKALGAFLGLEPDRYPGTPFLWLRLPSLVADVVGSLLLGPLLRARMGARGARVVVAALALSPLTWLVGVWHANTDLVWSVLVLGAALVLEWPFPRRAVYSLRVGPLRLADLVFPSAGLRAFTAGVLVAIAAAIKLPAVIALAPLGIVAERERRGGPFGLGFLVPTIAFVGWGFAGGGYAFLDCVIGFKGTLTAVPWVPERFARTFLGEDARVWLLLHGHLLVAVTASLVALAWARRGLAGDALAATFAAVLLVLPVFGCPYLAWAALPLVLLGWRQALLFHVAALFEAWVVYDYPFDKLMTEEDKASALSVWPALSTWLVLLGVLILAIRKRHARAGIPTRERPQIDLMGP